MLKPTICFLICLGLTGMAAAQRHTFKNYTTHDGLVQTDITDITQDKRGAIWIGTKGGLSVFDGKTFTNYDDYDVLGGLYVNGLFCDNAGTMWVATDNGLLKYTTGFCVAFKAPPGKPGLVNSLTASGKNDLLFVSNNTAYRMAGAEAETYSLGKTIDGRVDFIAFDRDDNLWIVTTAMEVFRKTGSVLTRIRTPFNAAYKQKGLGMIKVLGKQGPSPCFVTNFGSFWVRGDSLCPFAGLHPSFGGAKVGLATYALQDDDSTLWVGGTAGLLKLTANTTTRFAEDNGFCDNSVSCLFTDREKNLWIGCTYNGVYKLANEALFYLKSSTESLALRHVSAVSELPGNGVLLGTWGKGLFLLKGDSVSKTGLPPMVRYITCLFLSGNDTYIGWFGPGLWRMNNRTHTVTSVPGFVAFESVAMLYKAGDDWVVQTLGDAGYVTDETFAVKAKRQLPEGWSLSVANNKIYCRRTDGQVELLDKELQTVRQNVFPQIGSRITQITGYRDCLLVSTFGQGLFVYDADGKLLMRLDKSNGLHTNIVTSLLVDGSRLFMGSNLGLLRADLPGVQNIKAFTESEGLFNWECRPNGLKKLASGGVVIATTNGPYLYYPEKDVQPPTGVVTVADFCYGSNHFSFPVTAAAVHLPQQVAYNDNTVTVTLKGISQRAPDDVVYHYQLGGDDPMWIATANPVITFDNLAPGDYNLRAYITIGNFTSKPLSIKFSVDKPLSGKLWFQALLVLALSGLCWALLTVGNRIYQRYVQSKTLGELEKNIARKQGLTTGSVLLAKEQYDKLCALLKEGCCGAEAGETAGMFLADAGKRIEWLWQKETLTTTELHRYFDELTTGYGKEAKIYHKQSSLDAELAVTTAFPLVQLFSLYLIVHLCQNNASVFSLDSETKAAGRLLLRFYTLTPVTLPHKAGTYQFLSEAIADQKTAGLTVDVIENSAFGNMLVAEVNL